jgi:hypothetical protein
MAFPSFAGREAGSAFDISPPSAGSGIFPRRDQRVPDRDPDVLAAEIPCAHGCGYAWTSRFAQARP